MAKLTVDDTVLALAAAVVNRAKDLIQDGWVKGRMMTLQSGAPVEFCVHGALDLALEEVFGQKDRGPQVEAIAVAYIVDEARTKHGFRGSWNTGAIPAATFNDSSERKHEDVLGVLQAAEDRLWGLSLDAEEAEFSFSQWADVDVESAEAKQFLYATLN